MRRWRLWRVLAGLAVVLAAGVFMAWPRTDRVTEENFRLLRVGMSRAEVETILGLPGDYRSGETEADYRYLEAEGFGNLPEKGIASKGIASAASWANDRQDVGVGFDSSGNVCYGWCVRIRMADGGPLDNLWWRAERQWRRWFPVKPEGQ